MELFEQEELLNLLNSDDLNKESFLSLMDKYHPYEIYELLKEQDIDIKDKFYSMFEYTELSKYFEQYDEEFGMIELSRLSPKVSSCILENMELDDSCNFLREFDEVSRARFFKFMDSSNSSILKKMLSYDEDTIGSLFNPDFISVSKGLTIKEASKLMVKDANDTECIDYIYVLDNKHLIGVLSLRELLTTNNEEIVENVMINNLQYLHTFDKPESAVYIMQDYDLTALPILNDKEQMVGIVTIDDVIDIVNEESEEDFSKFAAINGGEIDDLDESPIKSVGKRIPWLLFLLFIGIFTSSIIASFESTIASISILAVFLPLVLDMSGNVGTQSLATTIRLLSSGQLEEKKEANRHLRRELGIGILNGFVVSIIVVLVVFGFMFIKSGNEFIFNNSFKTSLIIGFSMFISLIVTNLCGALIPIIISKFKIDPASASGPFITTLSDIISLFIYFGLSTLLLL